MSFMVTEKPWKLAESITRNLSYDIQMIAAGSHNHVTLGKKNGQTPLSRHLAKPQQES
jgi:hypothetical protein